MLALVAGAAMAIWEGRQEPKTLDEIQQAHRASDAEIQSLVDRRRR